jgi:HlyD family secretion protein
MPSHAENRATPFVLWGAGILAVLAIVASIRFLTRERVAVRTAQVTYQDLVKTIPTVGKVEPIDDFPAYAQAPGIVEAIYVSAGEHVKAGQLLMKLDDADARARLASATSALEAAKLAVGDIARGGTQDERNTYDSDLNRAKLQQRQDATSLDALRQLQQEGAASPAEVAAAQDRLQIDDSNLHSIQQHSTQRYDAADRAGAEARLADAEAAVAAAQSAVAGDNIRSKVSGTVYSIPVSVNDYVAAGADLIYVADLNRIQVTAYFDEPDVGSLSAGQPVTIAWDAKPGRLWHGHITLAPTSIIAYNTRNVGECEITVDDAQGELQPNANVTVSVTTAQHDHVLSVPREALRTDGPQVSYVFRIIDNKLIRTPVQIGILNDTRAEIVSGLAEGDTVALNAVPPRDLTVDLEVTPIK